MRFDQVFLFSKISALAFDNRQIDTKKERWIDYVKYRQILYALWL